MKIKRGFGIEEGTLCCPALLSETKAPVTVKHVKRTSNLIEPRVHDRDLKTPGSTYLITNQLKVMEGTTCDHLLDLLQQNQVRDVSSLHRATAAFGATELQKLSVDRRTQCSRGVPG